MTGKLILRGIAWNVIEEEGRHHIRRLPSILDATGQPVGPNDIFASDLAAREFVELMAERGNYECEAVLMMVREEANGRQLDDVPPVRTTL